MLYIIIHNHVMNYMHFFIFLMIVGLFIYSIIMITMKSLCLTRSNPCIICLIVYARFLVHLTVMTVSKIYLGLNVYQIKVTMREVQNNKACFMSRYISYKSTVHTSLTVHNRHYISSTNLWCDMEITYVKKIVTRKS